MKKTNKSTEADKKRRPALTPEARENQMVALAMDAAEKQLRNGTASSQVITHYLKIGSAREKIEKEILEKKKELISAQTLSIQSAQRVEDIYREALDAMRLYSGHNKDDDEL